MAKASRKLAWRRPRILDLMQWHLSFGTIDQEKEAMFAVNQDEADKSVGRVLKDIGGVFLPLLALIGSRFHKVICWLGDEWRRNATIRELNGLNDHCLDDIGIRRRYVDLRTDDLVKRLRAGG